MSPLDCVLLIATEKTAMPRQRQLDPLPGMELVKSSASNTCWKIYHFKILSRKQNDQILFTHNDFEIVKISL